MFQNMSRYALVGATLTVFAMSQACASNSDVEQSTDGNEAIVGGTVSATNAWPGAVAVYKDGYQACGGSLIAPQWVLTAGHCVDQGNPQGGFTKVVIGKNKLSASGGESKTVDKTYRNPNFTTASGGVPDNDLALLHLTTASTATPVKLIPTSDVAQIVAGATTTVVGWGTMSEGAYSTSDDLRQVDVPIIDNAKCKADSGYSAVSANMICAAFDTGGKDSCQGDSGGPLFMKIADTEFQMGIVSWGLGCAEAKQPGVYTRVSNYYAWIKATAGVDPDAAATVATPATHRAGTGTAATGNGSNENGIDTNAASSDNANNGWFNN